jgi:hypothetical protein
VLAGLLTLAVHAHRVSDFLQAAGILGVVIVVLVLAFGAWLNTQRTWFGGWRNRGPMG